MFLHYYNNKEKKIGGGDVDFQQSFEREVQQSIQTGSVIDLSDDRYKSNIEIVKKVLSEKYNVDVSGVTSFDGAKIENGRLFFPESTEIDLTTNENLVISSSGSVITSFTDSKTEISNGQDLVYEKEKVEATNADKVVYEEIIIENAEGFSGSNSAVNIVSAETLVVEDTALKNIADIEITKEKDKITSISFTCTENSLQTVSSIRINCLKDKKAKAEIIGEKVILTLDKDLGFSYGNLQGISDENNAKFTITQGEDEKTTTIFEINGIKEVIIAKSETKFRIDQNQGIYFVSLGIGSRISHQEADETKSFYFLNTGTMPFELFIAKPSHAVPENALNYVGDKTVFNSIVEFGIYEQGLPYLIADSKSQDNKIIISDRKLIFNSRCSENMVLFSLHNSDFNVLEACNNGLIEKYADFEYVETQQYVSFYSTPYNNAEISFENGILTQNKNGKTFTLYSKNSFENFLNIIRDYNSKFLSCNQIENSGLGKSFSEWIEE